ncbi:MAG: hypothetical protein HQM11_11745 [SAR324 cluster bacterium]|nr:hypothetical protein [SAR324 cluster bacterium]
MSQNHPHENDSGLMWAYFKQRLLNKQPLMDYGFRSIELQRCQIRGKNVSLWLSTLLILLEIVWIGQRIYTEFTTPTRQFEAMRYLLEYATSESIEDKQEKYNQAVSRRIYIWPKEGITLDEHASDFIDQIRGVLIRDYEKEYRTLPNEERDSLIFRVFPDIQRDIAERIKFGVSLVAPNEIYETANMNLRLSLLNKSVGFSRYSWHGVDKSLYYFLRRQISTPETSHQKIYSLYLASLSDIADKVAFTDALMFPLLLLLSTSLFMLFLNILGNQKETKMLRIQSRIRNASHFEGLVEYLHQAFGEIRGLKCHSCSIQLIHGNSFSLVSSGHRTPRDFPSIIQIHQDSVTAKRMAKMKESSFELFELRTSYASTKGVYSLSFPLIRANQLEGFVNLNFYKAPLGRNICFITNYFVFPVTEVFNTIYTSILERLEFELNQYRQWMYEQRELAQSALFGALTGKLNRDSATMKDILSPIRESYAVGIRFEKAYPLFPDALDYFPAEPQIIASLLSHIQPNRTIHTWLDRKKLHVLIPLEIPFDLLCQDNYALLIFEDYQHVTQVMVNFFHRAFQEYVRNLLQYSERTSHELAYTEAVRVATGLQEEVQEMLIHKVDSFMLVPGNSILPKEDIADRIHALIHEEIAFTIQGFGILIEVDLSKSTEIKKRMKVSREPLYEAAIQKMNDQVLKQFQLMGRKFITPNPSGGDGDGLRFFVTAMNERHLNNQHYPQGQGITPEEKEAWKEFFADQLLALLWWTHAQGIPCKLGGLILDSTSPMQLSIERGSLKIHSFLEGYLEQSRFVKGHRMQTLNEEQTGPGIDYQDNLNCLGEIPERIYQPWKIVLPVSFQNMLETKCQNSPFLLRKFHTRNYFQHETSLKEYLEVSLKSAYPLMALFPALNRLPAGWSVVQAAQALTQFARFMEQHPVPSWNSTSDLFDAWLLEAPQYSRQEAEHYFLRVREKVEGPGLYMILDSEPLSQVPLKSLAEHLNALQRELVTIEITADYAEQLKTVLDRSHSVVSPEDKDRIMRDANHLFEDYCGKMGIFPT